jgi:exopolyphosphatase/guanosine-5'-triphosphate,3'-diphosphate pyrophosphatase
VNESAPRPRRIGLVDVGSNAVRTRVVEVRSDCSESTLHEERSAVRVGRNVFVDGFITEATMDAVIDALTRFQGVCEHLGVETVRAVATAAARSARNADALLQRVHAIPVPLEIIDGDREAKLLRLAVGRRVDLDRGSCALIDLGAGSLEVVLLDGGREISAASYPLGSLLLFDALPAEQRDERGPELLAAIDALIAARSSAVAEQLRAVQQPRVLAVGGGIDIVCDLEISAGHGEQIDGVDAVRATALAQWRHQLAALDAAERTRQFGITPDRADLVVVALSVYGWLLAAAGADAVLVPRVSLRDGLLAEWLATAS